MDTFNALVIRKKWLDMILPKEDGTVLKTLEIRGCDCKRRGLILLVESGSGQIVGCAEIADSAKLTKADFEKTALQHRVDIPYECLPYHAVYGWKLKNAKRFKEPVSYDHPKGAIRWVRVPASDVLTKRLEEIH